MTTTIKVSFLIGFLILTSCTLNISVTKKPSIAPEATLLDVTPKEIFFLGGEKIRLKGIHFNDDIKVYVGDSECLNVVILNSEEMECSVPKFDSRVHGLASDTNGINSTASKKLNISIQTAAGVKSSLSETFQYKSDAFTKIEHFSGSLSHAGRRNGIATEARFYRPSSVVINDGYMYVADTENQLIRRVHLDSLQTEDFAGSYLQIGNTDGVGASATFNYPMGMTITGGNLYIAENGSCIIRKVNLSSRSVSILAGQPGVCVSATNHPVGTSAAFGRLTGITTDGNYLYVADDSKNIRKISLTGTNSVSMAHATLDTFGTVLDILYLNNSLYVTQFTTMSDFDIVKIDVSTGIETDLLHTSLRIGGLTTDGNQLYVSIPLSRRIQRVDLNAPALSNLIGSGTAGNTDGVGTAATLSAPSGLHFYNNDVYFTSFGSHNIRKFNINTLEVKTLVGNNK